MKSATRLKEGSVAAGHHENNEIDWASVVTPPPAPNLHCRKGHPEACLMCVLSSLCSSSIRPPYVAHSTTMPRSFSVSTNAFVRLLLQLMMDVNQPYGML
jgi:hypothetical protein